MKIGTHQIENPVALAPMAGVTDRPFRMLCRRLGAGWAVSEMISANSLLWGSTKTRRRADHSGEESPIVVQIVGADPKLIADAARYNVAHGAQVIDINMGCPARKICNVQAGAALLKDESLVAEILTAVVTAVRGVPVTLKIRTGWDTQHRNGERVARLAEPCGVQSLAVHGRTRACGYATAAEYETIRAIKAAVKIPVIANGDIRTPAQARSVLEYTGADGVMIGRAAQGRPWIFRQINHFLNSGALLPDPSPAAVRDIVLEHLESLYEFYGSATGLLVARKHLSWYAKGAPGAAAYRAAVNCAATVIEQRALTLNYFNSLADQGNSLHEEKQSPSAN